MKSRANWWDDDWFDDSDDSGEDVDEYSYEKDCYEFSCPSGQHISRIKSEHNASHGDRDWEFECRKGNCNSI